MDILIAGALIVMLFVILGSGLWIGLSLLGVAVGVAALAAGPRAGVLGDTAGKEHQDTDGAQHGVQVFHG